MPAVRITAGFPATGKTACLRNTLSDSGAGSGFAIQAYCPS